MLISGHTVGLDPAELRRYPTDIEGVPNRGAPVAAPDDGLSFPEVAAKAAAERPAEAESSLEAAKPERHLALWENEEFGFRDLIDIINPLQHIPIVATLYRHMTGEKIGAVPRVIGGALWGRLGGFVSGLVNAVVDWFTGKDIGDHIYAALFGDKGEAANNTAVAQTQEDSIVPPAALPRPQAALTPHESLAPASAKDAGKEIVRPSEARLPSLSSAAPDHLPSTVEQALLSSYVHHRKHDESDDLSLRLYLKA